MKKLFDFVTKVSTETAIEKMEAARDTTKSIDLRGVEFFEFEW